MAEKLKPCPFCGGEAYTIVKVVNGISADTIRFAVKCVNCNIDQHFDIACADSFEKVKSAMDKAIDAWNRRVDNGKV